MRNEKIKNPVINCITTEIELIIEENTLIGTTRQLVTDNKQPGT